MIAGGAGGMGLATALRFAADDARLVLADLPGPRLQEAEARVAGTGADVLALGLDIRSASACREAVAGAAAWGGRLDVLVNAAGVWLEGPAGTVAEDDWDRVLDINLKGAFFLISAAIPHLAAARGAVVNIASDAGLVGNSGAAVYCASKGGLVLLSKALALELAPQGIRVNAVCPGDVATPMIEHQANAYGGGDPTPTSAGCSGITRKGNRRASSRRRRSPASSTTCASRARRRSRARHCPSISASPPGTDPAKPASGLRPAAAAPSRC